MVLSVYRPPYSLQHPYRVTAFCNEFADLLTSVHSTYPNIIDKGVFSVHVNQPDTAVNNTFLDLIESLSLKKYIIC